MNFRQRFIKRGFDILFAAVGLFLLWPVMLLIALLIRMVDPGPVIFRQERVGRKGKLFYVHKFRTMSTEQTFRSTVTTLQDPRHDAEKAQKRYPARWVGGEVAEDLFNRGLCLPSGTAMTEDDVDRVIEVILRCRR